MEQATVAGLPINFKAGSPLPPALSAGADALSPEAQAEIDALKGARPWAFLWTLFYNWALVFILIASALFFDNIFVTIVVLYLIATRQMVLGFLMHEQVHGLGFGFKSKMGDLFTNFFVALPLLFLTVERYARIHLAHHKYFYTEFDPDFICKNEKEFIFPMKPLTYFWFWISDALGGKIIRGIIGDKIYKRVLAHNPTNEQPRNLPLIVMALYYVFFIFLFTYFHLWGFFLLFWIVPLAIFLPFLLRLGTITEHKYNILSQDVIDSTPIIILLWWERILLQNLNFGYHIYHHYYPQISFVHLPKIHEIYVREGLVNETNIFYGFGSFLKYLQRMKE